VTRDRTWPVRALTVEAVRNLSAATARTGSLLLIVTLIIAGITVSEVAFLARADDHERQFSAAGGYVVIVEAPNDIDGSRCRTLEAVNGFASSGGVRQASRDALRKAPYSGLPLFRTTTGYLSILGARSYADEGVSSDIGVGETTASETGLVLGSIVSTVANRSGRVTHIVDSLRNESMGRALIVVDDQLEIVDECWAEAERGSA
jgi:hypothetical protein